MRQPGGSPALAPGCPNRAGRGATLDGASWCAKLVLRLSLILAWLGSNAASPQGGVFWGLAALDPSHPNPNS